MMVPAPASRLRSALASAAGSASLAALVLGSIAAGCDRPSSGSTPTAAASGPLGPKHDTVGAIPREPVTGSLRGVPFVVRDARYVVDRRDGHEHVDLLLSDATSSEPCGALRPSDPARIWLRRAGAELPASGELRIDPSATPAGSAGRSPEQPWRAHYQLKEDGRWVGHGAGAAIGRLDLDASALTITGSISLCFADGRDSCAAGSFAARYCPSEIDRPLRGVEPAETPGTAPLRPSAEPAPTKR